MHDVVYFLAILFYGFFYSSYCHGVIVVIIVVRLFVVLGLLCFFINPFYCFSNGF